MTIHRSHTDSIVRRPRPPPVTGKTPRPLTPTRCTDTSAKAPAPDSLKLPPPYLAKLWQLNDQRTRQRPGASNRPRPPTPRSPAVATAHPAPGGPRSRSAGSSLVWDLRAGAARRAAASPRSLPERPAAGLLAATGRPPPPPAPPQRPGWRPERRPRTGGTTVAWATPPRHSPLLRPRSASMQPTCPPAPR